MFDWFIILSSSDKIEIFSIIASLVTSIIAIIISILTLIQNNKMIFESNKPNISIFTKVISFSSPYLYLILKNFGNNGATIINIEYDNELNAYFERKPFKNMHNVFIAPNQSFVYPLDFDKDLDKSINFKIKYKYLKKDYVEICTVNLNHYKDICSTKIHNSNDLKELSEVLQEMTIQNI